MALIGLMTLSKLSASGDDVVWLMPFLRNQKSNALIYLMMMTLVCCFSIIFSLIGVALMTSVLNEEGYWNAERVLSLTGSILLMIFAMWLLYDDCYGNDDSDDECEEEEENPDELTSSAIDLISHPSQVALLPHNPEDTSTKDEQMEEKTVLPEMEDEAERLQSGFLESDSDSNASSVAEAQIDPALLVHAKVQRQSVVTAKAGARAVARSSIAPKGMLVEMLRQSEQSVDKDAGKATVAKPKVISPRLSFAALTMGARRASFAALGSLTNLLGKKETAPTANRNVENSDPVLSLTDASRDLGMVYIHTEYTRIRLCTVCVLGSMDDAVIQIILLLSNQVQWYHLLLGNFIGSCVVLCVTLLGSRITSFADCMEYLPLWVVIGLFSIYCLTFTFVE